MIFKKKFLKQHMERFLFKSESPVNVSANTKHFLLKLLFFFFFNVHIFATVSQHYSWLWQIFEEKLQEKLKVLRDNVTGYTEQGKAFNGKMRGKDLWTAD